jgi:ABC-type Zn uptake system ZnuABC Zn-binding protein ZnuA
MRMRSLLVPAVVAAVAVGALVPGCSSPVADGWPDRPGPKVVASFAPIQCFALNVAGDDAVVRPAMTTQGPHHFEPGPADVRLLTRADLFLINGLQLDDSLGKKMVTGSGNKNLRLVNLGAKLPEAMLIEGGCACCAEGHKHDGHAHDHEHGLHDPHVWMGLAHAEKMVEGIRDELKGLDPAKAGEYDRRAGEYVGKLRALKAEGDQLLKDKKDRKFLTFHESLNYFAETFDLTVAGVIEEVPGSEPTPKQLTAIIEKCVKRKVRVIAVEPQYSSKTAAQQIVDELKKRGVEDPRLVVIDPMETATEAEMAAGWYEAKMRANLKALADALK